MFLFIIRGHFSEMDKYGLSIWGINSRNVAKRFIYGAWDFSEYLSFVI